MKTCVLFRPELSEFAEAGSISEFDICKQNLPTFKFRSDIPGGSLVIGRYSVLPFYKELEEELASKGSCIANSYSQHQFIADVMQWAPLLGKDITPRTWSTWDNLPEGKYVLKGKTNSRKFQWNTHMFASCRADVPVVASRLLDDCLISTQGLVIREFVPLVKLEEGINGLPICEEYRMFFWKTNLLCSGFYWSIIDGAVEKSVPVAVKEFANNVAKTISQHANFFVLDIGIRNSDRSPILIEVNDGQMSGLSCCNSADLYGGLSKWAKDTRES